MRWSMVILLLWYFQHQVEWARLLNIIVYKRLANLLSIRCNIPYPTLMGWLHCTLNFSLLKSSKMSVRGSRSHSGHPVSHAPADLVLAESRVSPLPH